MNLSTLLLIPSTINVDNGPIILTLAETLAIVRILHRNDQRDMSAKFRFSRIPRTISVNTMFCK